MYETDFDFLFGMNSINSCIFHHSRQDYLGVRKEKCTLQALVRKRSWAVFALCSVFFFLYFPYCIYMQFS